MLDQALDPAERFGERPDLRAGDELDRLLLGGSEERDHAAEVLHLALRGLMARVARQPWIENVLDVLMRLAVLDATLRVLAVTLHPQRPRLQAAEDEQRVERARHAAQRLLEEVQTLRDRRVVRRREAA